VPGLVNLSDFAAEADGVAKIVLESVQELLLKLALQMARDNYETRRERQRQGVQLAKIAGKYAARIPDTTTHQRIVALCGAGYTIKRTLSWPDAAKARSSAYGQNIGQPLNYNSVRVACFHAPARVALRKLATGNAEV